jgi:ParB-like chromosome segregation protein Spo0J
MDIRNVALDDLVLDPNLNLRDRLDDFTVERYAEAWDRLPPITVYDIDNRWLIADGFHRHAAAVMLGKRTIPVEIRSGTFNDALDYVSSVNLFHGLPLSRTERRRAVEVKLRLHHDWSDRRTAEELGVSRELVAKIRKQLIEGFQIPNNPGRVGSDGKLYTTAGLPRDPEERAPRDRREEADDGAERGRRAMSASSSSTATAAPPWDDAPAAKTKNPIADEVHFAGGVDPRIIAAQGPIDVAAPSIDELLDVMSKQIMQVVTWTQAEGFLDGYREASSNARGIFHAAVIKLAARADQMRRS